MTTTATGKQKTSKDNNQPAEPTERKISLLVVEDDENISSAISEYFSRAGYNVKTVEDGLMGVKSALDDPPDAVVLDLMLPKMDGLERAAGKGGSTADSHAHRKGRCG
jgi:PleD family two-component response regulator